MASQVGHTLSAQLELWVPVSVSTQDCDNTTAHSFCLLSAHIQAHACPARDTVKAGALHVDNSGVQVRRILPSSSTSSVG